LLEGGVIAGIAQKHDYLVQQIIDLQETYGVIEEIRGMGLLLGIVVPDAKAFANTCFEKGMLVATAGSNVVRLLPPLNVAQQDLDEALKILKEVIIMMKEK